MNQAIQLALALFGLTSAYMAMVSLTPQAKRWAPIVGLAGQPFWLAFAWGMPIEQGWPLLFVTVPAFTLVYLKGTWIQWSGKLSKETT